MFGAAAEGGLGFRDGGAVFGFLSLSAHGFGALDVLMGDGGCVGGERVQ